MKANKIKFLIGTFLVFFGFLIINPNISFASTKINKSYCQGAEEFGGNCSVQQSTSSTNTLIKDSLNIISYLFGVVSVIMIIISGIKFTTSAGDANKVSSAKATLIYAIIGIFVVVTAQLIVGLVLSSANTAAGFVNYLLVIGV